MDEADFMTMFQGQAGQPVPQVDPLDIKAVWQIGKETMESHPGQNVGIGVEFFERACKPGANIPAVTYRAGMIAMFQRVAPELLDPLLQDKLDAVFQATAEIPMEWIGAGVRSGFPFDPDDFLRRVREA
jgi:hypothetical protein